MTRLIILFPLRLFSSAIPTPSPPHADVDEEDEEDEDEDAVINSER